MSIPALMIAAPQGRSGKTTVSTGLCAALRRKGLKVSPFKKGPDYIDPSWLSAASGVSCSNLDPFMFEKETLTRSFHGRCKGADIAVIEASMGLYDSPEEDGYGSSAWLARLLQVPVILVVNATRITRSAAAMVKGYLDFEPGTDIAGVVFNNVNGRRHRDNLVRSIEKYCGIPVLGCLPFDGGISIKERHLGIVPCTEHEDVAGIIERSRRLIENNLDIENIIAIANRAMAPGTPDHAGKRGTATSFSARCERRAATLAPGRGTQSPSLPKARIGVFFDKAFSFYYPENLEALQDAGAELIYINSFQDTLPGVDGLYIGGGFPELYPAELEANHNLRSQVCSASREGLPVYAECAGLMYLGRSIIKHGRRYAMAGVFDTDAELRSKPLGHGYMQVEVNRVNPFFKPGAILKGHEFHYSYLSNNANSSTAFRVIRGTGIDGHSDGLVSGNTLATYLHLHALSTFEWAGNFVKLALSHKIKQAKIAV